ncbi:hypothetical protein EJ06DRAFT_509925 [Trichodelitschia bisporula]|uniref:rhamnogalacturonan endolyase n=1 Tax=Trichodelitschia bisporula TaxID=703511 RepID=A0A6G1HYX9_9PEZI|nr:hypothetical protein EJ06DRAFT_509925 [Trichodelitschia bisporula]
MAVLRFWLWALVLAAASALAKPGDPFFKKLNEKTYQLGNDFWNVTVIGGFGKRLMYNGVDLVGNASGHYVSYNGAANNLSWNLSPPRIVRKSGEYTDIMFSAAEGDMHWVLTPTLLGAYQYFVNRALPRLGEFRTLWRLSNDTFTHGWTTERDAPLARLAEMQEATQKTGDETWVNAQGVSFTKYDLSTFLPNIEGEPTVWGIYGKMPKSGEGIGSWYIHGGKDYLNGDHLKQELMIHRESITGDAVQLNMIHGTHYQARSNDAFAPGKTWGPWLWYLNNGSAADALARARTETAAWPYPWHADERGYASRGALSGSLRLSDGRPASRAAIFLGDTNATAPTLDQGEGYYYRTYAGADGSFHIAHVRAGNYTLHAWPGVGSGIGDVSTVFRAPVTIRSNGSATALDALSWVVPKHKPLFQIGALDRTATGFGLAGGRHEHARARGCPAALNFTVGVDGMEKWCFAQGQPGTWAVRFKAGPGDVGPATLTVSLAAYSAGASAGVYVNDERVGELGPRTLGPGDPSLYRSGTLAGEWRFLEWPAKVREGENVVEFRIAPNSRDKANAANIAMRGFMWDSVLLRLN